MRSPPTWRSSTASRSRASCSPSSGRPSPLGFSSATTIVAPMAPRPTMHAAGSRIVSHGAGSVLPASFGLLQDIMLEVSVELGRSSMPLAQLMNLGVGSIVELDRAAGSPVDVRVNGMLFARGEVVALDDEYAVRIIEILGSPRQ